MNSKLQWLRNTMASLDLQGLITQRFVGFNIPDNTTYMDLKYNPRVEDIYVYVNEDTYECKGMYMRTKYVENPASCEWLCLWSKDPYIDAKNIINNTITADKIANNTITKNQLSNDFTNNILYGTFGTEPMYEGDELQAGHLYIQYDESVGEEE